MVSRTPLAPELDNHLASAIFLICGISEEIAMYISLIGQLDSSCRSNPPFER